MAHSIHLSKREWIEEAHTRGEHEAVKRLLAAISFIQSDLRTYWHWGDEAAIVLDLLRLAAIEEGLHWPFDPYPKRGAAKAKISKTLSRSVMERDAYRCVTCGSHVDLTCDHIIPESKGGPTTLDNLQTMCRRCNCSKGNRV